jgi:hypothetical protein
LTRPLSNAKLNQGELMDKKDNEIFSGLSIESSPLTREEIFAKIQEGALAARNLTRTPREAIIPNEDFQFLVDFCKKLNYVWPKPNASYVITNNRIVHKYYFESMSKQLKGTL